MKSFLKTLLATIIGNIVAVCVLAFCATAVLAAFLAGFVSGIGDSKTTHIPDGAFLVFNLGMNISDAPASKTVGALAELTGTETPRMGLWDLTETLAAAAKDDHIRGVFLTGSLVSDNYASGLAALAELRRALRDFKKTAPSKHVIAYLESPALKDYYLASVADEIWLNPYGEVGLRGLVSQNIYLGKALTKYGVGVQVVKCGRYKSAVESLTADKMSDNDREQRSALIDSQWGTVVADIAAARKTTPQQVSAVVAADGILDAPAAVAAGLADKTGYLDEVITHLRDLGTPDGSEGGSFTQVSLRDYARARHSKEKHEGPAVVIIYAEGEISSGGEGRGVVNGNRLAALLRRAAADETARAVVLRVNSPGGSAFASEVIQREMRRLAVSGKPVVVSMGSVAASGGYWISAFAKKIFAEKTTVTGSIGVFGIAPNVRDLAASWGVSFDSVKTAPFADIETLTRPRTADEMDVLQKHTDKIYGDFLDKVAKGRKLERATVAQIAEGRVWAGAAAQEIGLVDSIGGLRDAVAYAATTAGLPEGFTVRQLPEPSTAWENFVALFSDDGSADPVTRARVAAHLAAASPRRSLASQMLRAPAKIIGFLCVMDDPLGVYARLPYWEIE
ncbi:MAG: signal peptide peptidase SppA [Puniceicoccales bacterium]|jgi:protease-4|nr:signal peptide peptidase SppA [Puniceicoccales bacterium]